MSVCCLLKSYENVSAALCELLEVSKSQVKKRSHLKSSILAKSIKEKSELSIPDELFNYGMISPEYEGPSIEVLFEDDNFIVFNKPSNIYCHPLQYNEKNNLLSFMRNSGLGKILELNAETYDRGLIHRLDFETSGVLIYCKNRELKQEIMNNRDEFIQEKIYFAKTQNRDLEVGLYTHYSEERPHHVIMHENQRDRHWKEVQLEVLENDCGLLKVKLITGSRHQIRAQMKALDAPIDGDELYGGTEHTMLCLHSFSYQLEVKNKKLNFEAKLPNW